MKRLFLLLLTMCSFTFSYSQSTKDLMTPEEKEYSEKTKDDAYLAPMSKLVGKKWYLDSSTYCIFNQNGTGAFVAEYDDNDYSHPIKYINKVPFKWKRNGVELLFMFTPKLNVYQPVESSLSQLSPREKAKVKKNYAEWQTKERNKEYSDEGKWYEYEICKLTNDIFIFDFDGITYSVTKKKYNEMNARSKE